MSSSPDTDPHYEWNDELGRWKRRAGTHSGAKELQRRTLRARKRAIDNGEEVEPTTQNSYYYYLRTIFLANGIDPAKEGTKFRRAITNQIDDICREFGTTREDLKIIADARATFYYNNERYHLSLKNIRERGLYLLGTDIIIIEKAALCDLLAPLATKVGIALVDTKGYVVDYAKALSSRAREYGGHVSMITDFDTDGLLMALDVRDRVSRDIYRIGIDFDTIDELKQMYPELSENLRLQRLEESYTAGHSLKRLKNLEYFGIEEKKLYERNLYYLKTKRIEIDSVQRAVGYQKLWTFIIKKLQERFPERDYNRAIKIPRMIFPNIYLEFQKILEDKIKPELDVLKEEVRASFEEYQGMMDNINVDEIALIEYFKMEINNTSNLIDILDTIKELVEELKDQNIKSFMESTF